jgi:hypothetical protein
MTGIEHCSDFGLFENTGLSEWNENCLYCLFLCYMELCERASKTW